MKFEFTISYNSMIKIVLKSTRRNVEVIFGQYEKHMCLW